MPTPTPMLSEAVEELLLRHRTEIDDAIRRVQEETQLDTALAALGAQIVGMQDAEPSFWELRIVQYIYAVVCSKLEENDPLREHNCEEQDYAPVLALPVSGEESTRRGILEQVTAALRAEMERLATAVTWCPRITHEPLENPAPKPQDTRDEGPCRPELPSFLARFWDLLAERIHSEEDRDTQYEEGVNSDGHAENDGDDENNGEISELSENNSYDAITFDELQLECGSNFSAPCIEALPALLESIQQSGDADDRAAAFNRVREMSIVELVHCGPHFTSLCTSLVDLFMDEDRALAQQAVRMTYALVRSIEEAARFRDLYMIIIEFVNARCLAGALLVDKQSVFSATEPGVLQVVDVYRMLHLVLCRMHRHWIHFPTETLAEILCATFTTLTMGARITPELRTNPDKNSVAMALHMVAVLDPEAEWIDQWVLKAPRREQFFQCLEDTGFLACVMRSLARVRPLERSFSRDSRIDQFEKCLGRNMVAIASCFARFERGRSLLIEQPNIHSPPSALQKEWWVSCERGDPVKWVTNPLENDRVCYATCTNTTSSDSHDQTISYPPSRQNEKDLRSKCTIRSLAMSILAMYLLEPCELNTFKRDEWMLSRLRDCIVASPPSRHGELVRSIAAILNDCINLPNCEDMHFADFAKSSVTEDTEVDSDTELEQTHPWFPFRRVTPTESIRNIVVDAARKRLKSGLLLSGVLYRRIEGVLVVTLSVLPMLECSVDVTDTQNCVMPLGQCIKRILHRRTLFPQDKCPGSDQSDHYRYRLLQSICTLVGALPAASVTLCEQVKIIDEVHSLLELSTSNENTRAERDFCRGEYDIGDRKMLVDVLIALAQNSIGLLHESRLDCLTSCMTEVSYRWLQGACDTSLLPLFVIPAATEAFFKSKELKEFVESVTDPTGISTNDDFAIALQSRLDECPPNMREQFQVFSRLFAVMSTQHAATIVFHRDSRDTALARVLTTSITAHEKSGASSSAMSCRRTTSSEDRCTLAFQLLTPMIGCIPSMFSYYAIANGPSTSRKNTTHACSTDLESHSISACSFLELQMQNALMHVGQTTKSSSRRLDEFDGDAPLCPPTVSVEGDGKSIQEVVYVLPKSVQSTVKQLTAIIEEAVAQNESLEFVRFSQATWELIEDIEKERSTMSATSLHHTACCEKQFLRELTRTMATLMYVILMSGCSKIVETGRRNATGNREDPIGITAKLSNDAERRQMNAYYKGYCTHLGLSASSTTLHVLGKNFGPQALDVFPITMLMVLGEKYGEQDIVAFLAYCSSESCRSSCAFMWPRLEHQHSTFTLLPIAQAAEMILAHEYPQFFITIRQCGGSVLALVVRWLTQCYWNYLSWDNILISLQLTFTYGIEFQVYLVVAYCQHLEPITRELIATNIGDMGRVFVGLMQQPLTGFRYFSWRQQLLRWRNQYRDRVQRILQSGSESACQ